MDYEHVPRLPCVAACSCAASAAAAADAAPRRDTPHTTLHVHAYRNGAKLVVFSHYISYNSEITGKNLPFEVKEVSHRLH